MAALLNNTIVSTLSQSASRVAYVAYHPFHLLSSSLTRATLSILDLGPTATLGQTQVVGAAVEGAVGDMATFPGPWSFLQSGFALGLCGMAILVNRIYHLVPPRRPTANHLSPALRFSIRLPSLLLLLRAILLLVAVLGFQNGYSLGRAEGFVKGLVKFVGWATSWAGRSTLKGMLEADVFKIADAQIMWDTFVAVGLASVTETFVRALDDDLASQTTFNLLSFSFLLHVHSHSHPSVPSPAPAQLYIHLLTVLTELLTLHLSFSFTPPLPALRLPITGFFSVLGQGFVLRGLLMAWRNRDQWVIVVATGSTGSQLEPGDRIWAGSVWLNRAPEMVFEILIGLTVGLKLLAALLRREVIDMDTIFGHPTHFPRMDQDFAVEMIKYGTACLESTRLAGLSNEVTPIRSGPLSYFSSPPSLQADVQTVRLSRSPSSPIGFRKAIVGEEMRGGKKKVGEGLGNEVVSIEAVPREGEEDGGNRGRRAQDKYSELWKFAMVVMTMVFLLSLDAYRKSVRFGHKCWRAMGAGGDVAALDDSWRAVRSPAKDEDQCEEEGDGDYLPSDGSGSSSEESRDGSDEDDNDNEDDFDPRQLYSDLSQPLLSTSATDEMDGDAYAPVILAHHLTTSASPLTRRRYNALAHPTSSAYSTALQERREDGTARRQNAAGGEEDDGRQRLCVVCVAEERTIILWPCRCLSICEECRENLAERTPSNQHLCPTCRTEIKGFSRIIRLRSLAPRPSSVVPMQAAVERLRDGYYALAACLCTPDATLNLNGRRYKIMKLLGEGGFSYVYLAEDLESGRLFALKKIRCPLGSDSVREALKEVEAYKRFRHPNIIRCLDSCVVQDKEDDTAKIIYLFLPYYKNGTVQNIIAANAVNGTHYPERAMLNVFLGTLQAVRAMHHHVSGPSASYPPAPSLPSSSRGGNPIRGESDETDEEGEDLVHKGMGEGEGEALIADDGGLEEDEDEGIVLERLGPSAAKEVEVVGSKMPWAHRDIKPANIMLSDDSTTPILMDFGSACPALIPIPTRSAALAAQDTAAEQCSMPFRAPELFDVKTGIDLDAAVDIWSLGCTLFAMAYGTSPFETTQQSEHGGSIAMAVLNGKYAFPSEDRYSEGTRGIIKACLVVKPEGRPDIDQVIRLTEGALAGLA